MLNANQKVLAGLFVASLSLLPSLAQAATPATTKAHVEDAAFADMIVDPPARNRKPMFAPIPVSDEKFKPHDAKPSTANR